MPHTATPIAPPLLMQSLPLLLLMQSLPLLHL
jgi:hypothetical protein